MLALITDSKKC